MAKPTKIKGRAWVIQDEKGRRIDNIDTDMIYHNKHLAVTDMDKMGQYIFGNLQGWEDFPNKVREGDILVVGRNFGSGSSRQHAVDGFIALGIRAIVGESFGSIYWRNAVNGGVPVLVAPNIMESQIESGDEMEIDLESGKIEIMDKNEVYRVDPMSQVQKDIYQAGGLFEYAKRQ